MYDSNIYDNSNREITIKISARPVKYYKISKCSEENLKDYKFFQNLSKHKGKYQTTFFLIKGTSEVKITDNDDWNDYYNNGVIKKLIDSRGVLKVEYVENKQSHQRLTQEDIKQKNEKKFTTIMKFYTSEWLIGHLKEVLIENENIQKEMINYFCGKIFSVKNGESEKNNTNGIKSNAEKTAITPECFNNVIGEKLEKIKKKLEVCREIEDSLQEEEVENSHGSEEKENPQWASFSDYYDNSIRETFQQKIIRETMDGAFLSS